MYGYCLSLFVKTLANLNFTNTMIPATANVILDTRRQKRGGTYPSKLRIIHDRRYKDYATGLSLTEEDFAKVTGPKPRGEYKEQRLYFNAIEQRAAKIIKGLHPFSYEAFERDYLEKRDKKVSVYDYYAQRIEELTKNGSAGTVGVYVCAFNSLKSFHPKALQFGKVTPEFLKEYDRWMLAKGNSPTTISMYLRTLRTLYNTAIEDGVCKRESYPFSRRRYQVPATRNVKKALALPDIAKLFNYQPETDSEAKYRDLWLFSYLASGITTKDICRLRYRDVDGDRVTFVRAKTASTSRGNLKPIQVILPKEAQTVIQRWGVKPTRPDAFVFGFLSDDITPDRERRTVNQVSKMINTYIGKIAERVGIQQKVTTYTARHSYATVLKRSGVSIAFISESLGHTNLKTTEHYLASFEDDTRRKYAAALTNFE